RARWFVGGDSAIATDGAKALRGGNPNTRATRVRDVDSERRVAPLKGLRCVSASICMWGSSASGNECGDRTMVADVPVQGDGAQLVVGRGEQAVNHQAEIGDAVQNGIDAAVVDGRYVVSPGLGQPAEDLLAARRIEVAAHDQRAPAGEPQQGIAGLALEVAG